MRICYLTFPPHRYSGAVYHAFWLAERLSRLGVEIEFLAVGPEDQPRRSTRNGFPVTYIRTSRRLGSYPELALVPQYARYLRAGRFDVLHVHGSIYLHAFAALAARLTGVKSITNIMLHGGDLGPVGRLATPLYRFLLRRFDRIVPISEETHAEALAAGFSPDRLVKIPISVDAERFRPVRPEQRSMLRERYGIPADVKLVTFVGALCERKNVLWLLDAWSRSAARRDSHLLVVGDAANDRNDLEVRRQVEARMNGSDPSLHWVPFVSAIEEVYAISDILVLPSRSEGMPSVVGQAMASGVPVLSTPVSGVPELLGTNGERGLIFGFGDTESFSRGLEALLWDPARSAAVSAAALEHIRSHCALDHVASRYLDLYRQLTVD